MDNERPIEKLLRDYAKKRRAGAGEPRKMHPATRRMLQGEVSRQYPKTMRGGSWAAEFFGRWRPGLVYALCGLAVVALSVPLLLQTFRKTGPEARHARVSPEKVEQESSAAAAPTSSAAMAPEADKALPVAAQVLTLNDALSRDASTRRYEDEQQKPQPALKLKTETVFRSAPEAPPAAAPLARTDQPEAAASLAVQGGSERPAREPRVEVARSRSPEPLRSFAEEPAAVAGDKSAAGRMAQPPASTASPPGTARVSLAAEAPNIAGTPPTAAPARPDSAESVAFTPRYGLAKTAAASVVQRFAQTQITGDLRRSTGRNEVASPVLTTFQVEQSGDQLRVIDHDGSTYTGAISPPAVNAYYGTPAEMKGGPPRPAGSAVAAQSISAPADSAAQAGWNYYFRVTGTNRTLQQPVVFAGNILVPTNVPPVAQPVVRKLSTPRDQYQFAPVQNQIPSFHNSTISGRVQLGTNKELQVNAVPIPP